MLAPAVWVDRLRELTGFSFAHTANANPITCAVGHAVLDVIEDEDLVERANDVGRYLRDRLEDVQQRYTTIGDIRGRGLLMAMEICRKDSKQPWPGDFQTTDRLRRIGLENGLILYARRNNLGKFGDWVMITPPLTITESQCDDYAQRLEATIAGFENELRRASLM